MDNIDFDNNERFKLDLSNAAQLASFAISLGALFALLRNYIYYVLFLHIPIFQYLDLSDIILIAPTAIFWSVYFGAIDAVNAISNSQKFNSSEKIFYGLTLYAFAGYLTWLGFHNEPAVEQGLKFLFRYWWLIIVLVIYVAIRLKANKNDFFKRNRYVAACVLTIWYAIFDSWANYSVLVNPSRHIHFVMKMKNGKKLIVDKDLIYVGRSKSYWFLYNPKTAFVRAIKNDDVEITDFDTITK